MKVISLLQPFATLVVIGAKKIETRSWNTKFRGEILIHASQRFGNEEQQLCLSEPFLSILKACGQLEHERKSEEIAIGKFLLPLGAIIGKVNIIDTFQFDEWTKNNLKYYYDYEMKKGWELNDQEIAFGDYSPNRYGWLLSDPVQFTNPIPAKGQLGIWNFNDEVAEKYFGNVVKEVIDVTKK